MRHLLQELSAPRITAYHCGRDNDGAFSLDYVGSGEGTSSLGPGIYFSSTRAMAERYCKYAKDKKGSAFLYEVEIEASGLYNATTGQPVHLRDSLMALVDSLGVSDPYRGVNPLKHGQGSIGAVFKHLGPEKGREALIRAGITGCIFPVAGGDEIAVFDLSILSDLKSTKVSVRSA